MELLGESGLGKETEIHICIYTHLRECWNEKHSREGSHSQT